MRHAGHCGQDAQLGRAASISSDSVAEIPLGPPSAAQLGRLLEREEAIALAVDERYARLRPAVTCDPVFEGDLLDQMRSVIVGDGTAHTAACATLRDSLGDLAPADFLRATRRDPADAFEQRLLDISDRNYGLIMTALQGQFGQPDSLTAGTFRGLAISAMEGLDDISRVLVQRGLLPLLRSSQDPAERTARRAVPAGRRPRTNVTRHSSVVAAAEHGYCSCGLLIEAMEITLAFQIRTLARP
jgi:hypothetical protein